jgi:hypothetical protein
MGMDLSGFAPRSPKGEYFGANIFAWHPIATYIGAKGPQHIVRKCAYWHSNDNDGLDDETRECWQLGCERGSRMAALSRICCLRRPLTQACTKLCAISVCPQGSVYSRPKPNRRSCNSAGSPTSSPIAAASRLTDANRQNPRRGRSAIASAAARRQACGTGLLPPHRARRSRWSWQLPAAQAKQRASRLPRDGTSPCGATARAVRNCQVVQVGMG